MASWRVGGFRLAFLFSCCMLIWGCTLPKHEASGVNAHYAHWDVQHPGKIKLVWYYDTADDYVKGQPNRVLVDDKVFVIHQNVRPPTVNGIYLLEHSTINEGEEVLDIGTGTGVHAIFAAPMARRVVATDILSLAIENAKANAIQHNVDHKIDFRVGDLFSPLNHFDKFDVIFININFPFNPDDKERKSLHERFFSEVPNYLKPSGRIYFQIGFVDNLPHIFEMLSRNNLRIMEMHMEYLPQLKHEPLFLKIQNR